MKMQDAHTLGVLAFCGHQFYTVPVYLHVNGYVLASRGVTSNGTSGKLATAATAFMVYIGSDVMAMLSMPAGQENQRRERRSHVTSR